MKSLIEKEFGIPVDQVKSLAGYDNKNYRITSGQNKFVFKTYSLTEDLFYTVNAENDTLRQLAKTRSTEVPAVQPFLDQSTLKVIEIEEQPRICRMLSFM